MVTPLHAIRDLSLQPRKSSVFHLTRISKFTPGNFRPDQFEAYSTLLTEHLVREFRVTRKANKDGTIGVFRALMTDDARGLGDELGLFCVVESQVAPDHAKIDATLGPRTSVCDIVLCLGKDSADGYRFAFALTRGRTAIIKSTLAFIKRTFGGEAVPATVAPHHLVFLAREWTRDLDEDDDDGEEVVREEGRKFKRLTRLEMEFTLIPASSQGTLGDVSVRQGELESIHVTVEEESLRGLHTLVEKGEAMDGDNTRIRKNPALVTALANHLTKHLNVDLTGAAVTMIVTPTAELTSDGNVRFLWPSHLKRALLHLQEVAKAPAEQL